MEKGKDYTEEEEEKLEAQKEKKKNIRKKLKDFPLRGYSSLGLVSTEDTYNTEAAQQSFSRVSH